LVLFKSAGFVAKNVTVSVPIPATPATSVALRSVNGWLTVMSRVDINFPTSGMNYEEGFGYIESNFWLGLSKIYYLTNPNANGGHNYRLRVEMLIAGQAK
jgi:Fibrinogen beta and gamma chains, C-terminal globular domain